MDSGQFAVSTGMCCQRTPEPSRAVVQLHRTTDPPRAHLWPTFLCEEKGGSLAGRREKRLPSLATANMRAEEGGRRETLDQTGDSQQVSSGRRRLDETLDVIDVSPATDAAN